MTCHCSFISKVNNFILTTSKRHCFLCGALWSQTIKLACSNFVFILIFESFDMRLSSRNLPSSWFLLQGSQHCFWRLETVARRVFLATPMKPSSSCNMSPPESKNWVTECSNENAQTMGHTKMICQRPQIMVIRSPLWDPIKSYSKISLVHEHVSASIWSK